MVKGKIKVNLITKYSGRTFGEILSDHSVIPAICTKCKDCVLGGSAFDPTIRCNQDGQMLMWVSPPIVHYDQEAAYTFLERCPRVYAKLGLSLDEELFNDSCGNGHILVGLPDGKRCYDAADDVILDVGMKVAGVIFKAIAEEDKKKSKPHTKGKKSELTDKKRSCKRPEPNIAKKRTGSK